VGKISYVFSICSCVYWCIRVAVDFFIRYFLFRRLKSPPGPDDVGVFFDLRLRPKVVRWSDGNREKEERNVGIEKRVLIFVPSVIFSIWCKNGIFGLLPINDRYSNVILPKTQA
jgi:hypothetical protein